MLKGLALSALIVLPTAGCVYHHPYHPHVEREEVVEYDVAAPMPAERVEVVSERPYHDAVWHRGHWERGEHHWIWVHGYWS